MQVLTAGRGARVAVGLVLSLAFLAATVRQVDLGAVLQLLVELQPGWIVVALGLVALEVAVRAVRWQLLLRPFRPVPFRYAAGYLCVGYFANTLLPARLGDLGRAFLAGRTFAIPSLATLGTIVVERLADGLLILALVVLAGLAVASGSTVVLSALLLVAAGSAGLVALVGAAYLAHRMRLHETRHGSAVVAYARRVAVGAIALRRPVTLGIVAVLTLAAFGVAVGVLLAICAAVGVALTPLQGVVAMGGLALSTAIPASPGALGTYEFVGVAILTTFGASPEAALATVLLVHAVVALPPAVTGLATAWYLHFSVREAVVVPVAEPPRVLAA